MQRAFDILFSSIAITILSPVLIFIIFLLKFTGEGEIFFRQTRVGKKMNTFHLLKFVTMLKNSENLGAGTVTLKDDFRVLPVGKFLRKSKLNELPQLFNILWGDMSVIGPRPLHKKQFSFYDEDTQVLLSSIRPGLSGMGSVVFRDEEKILQSSDDPDKTYKNLITPKKAYLEKWYVKNQSFYLYFKLIFLTIYVVFGGKDVLRFFRNLYN